MGHTANPAGAGHITAAPNTRSEGVPGALIVATIAILVVMVSLPRFRAHVLDANRDDARLAPRPALRSDLRPRMAGGIGGGRAPRGPPWRDQLGMHD